MASLRAMFGDDIPEPEAMVFPRWLSDPWSRGGYSYPGVGSDPDDCTAHARPLGDRVFFAGEATEPVEYGTVHAALWSAEQTAETIFRLATGTAASRARGPGRAPVLARAGTMRDKRTHDPRQRPFRPGAGVGVRDAGHAVRRPDQHEPQPGRQHRGQPPQQPA